MMTTKRTIDDFWQTVKFPIAADKLLPLAEEFGLNEEFLRDLKLIDPFTEFKNVDDAMAKIEAVDIIEAELEANDSKLVQIGEFEED